MLIDSGNGFYELEDYNKNKTIESREGVITWVAGCDIYSFICIACMYIDRYSVCAISIYFIFISICSVVR